ncbi:MAG TPA: aromatic ring-opening dioxygenase LigA [Acidimicrobiia bacterium]
MRKTAYVTSVILGIILILGGAATWIIVSSELAAQNITVADDASCLAGDEVNGPLSAYCQAQVIDQHARESTGGLTYAELDREDPLRATAMNASFLRASLFTSVVAFGVAGMAMLMGIVFILIGLGMRDVGEKVGEL